MELYGTLKDLSSHLFVAVGDAEVSNTMTSYTMDQKVLVIETLRFFGGSWVSGGQPTSSRSFCLCCTCRIARQTRRSWIPND
jgi:hypothetical protein